MTSKSTLLADRSTITLYYATKRSLTCGCVVPECDYQSVLTGLDLCFAWALIIFNMLLIWKSLAKPKC